MVPHHCFIHSDPTNRGSHQLLVWAGALPSAHWPTSFPRAGDGLRSASTHHRGYHTLPSHRTPSSSLKSSLILLGLHTSLKLPATQHQMVLLLTVVSGSSFPPATTVALTLEFSALPLSSTKIHGYRPIFVGCTRPTALWSFTMGTNYSLIK